MKKIISSRLFEERKRLGLKKGEMASAGGIANSTYTNYEEGSRAPDGEFLAAIASKGADVQYILTGVRSGFSDRLKAERAAMGLSVAEFAVLGGVTEAEQLDYENGLRVPTGAYLAALAAVNVDVHTLLQGNHIDEINLQSLSTDERTKAVIDAITTAEKELGITITPEAMFNVIRYAFSYCENPAAIKEFLKTMLLLKNQG